MVLVFNSKILEEMLKENPNNQPTVDVELISSEPINEPLDHERNNLNEQ